MAVAAVDALEALLPGALQQASGSFKQWLTNTANLSPDIAALVPLGLLVMATLALMLVVSSVLGIGPVSGRKKNSNTLLLVGTSGSGKTTLFYKLLHNSVPECVTSIEPNVKTMMLSPEHGVASGKKPLTVVDFPGHGRLRTLLGPQVRDAKAVLFVIDATATEASIRADCAEVLYEVFVQCHKQNNRPALLVVCNKADVKGALSPKETEVMLQKQLDRLKETRHALVTANSEGDEDVMIGVDGQTFDFEADAPCSVEFARCSVKEGDLDGVIDFVSSAFPVSA